MALRIVRPSTVLFGVSLAAVLSATSFTAVLSAEDVLHLPIGDPARKDRDVPVVLDAITDTDSGETLTPAELPPRLAGVRLLLVGEEHTSMDTHAVERRVVEELDRSGRRVAIGLEMFPYTQQAALDDWSAGKLSEDEFLRAAGWYKHWGYNWGYYREVFVYARDHRLRMFAVNAPREVVTAVRKKGFQGLTPEEAAHIPTQIDTKSADHMRLFRASFADEGFHTGMDDAQWQAMLSAQCTWDATMAFHAVAPILKDEDPKAIVVVLAGSGHVQYGMGIERQARQWYPGRIASVIPVAVRSADDKGAPVKAVRASYASFVWGVPPEREPVFPDLGIATRAAEATGASGLDVLDVEKDSPAESAGLKAGDRLVSFDGAPVSDREALARAMAAKRWGDTAVLGIRRGDETLSLTVPLRRMSK
ncbi:MAG TPA: ChaN family lipoprotein [Thermoanaerobaculia bacterium]